MTVGQSTGSQTGVGSTNEAITNKYVYWTLISVQGTYIYMGIYIQGKSSEDQ